MKVLLDLFIVFQVKMSETAPGGSGGGSNDGDSVGLTDQDLEIEEIRSGDTANENVPRYKIGEATQNLDIRDSVAYSFNYFNHTYIDGVPHAICRTCEEEEKSSRSHKTKRVKKSKVLKTVGGSTRGKHYI